ncbi:dynamin-2B-like [Populus alba x Populus x berolinensis]|nr:dynamin-2B-like [Populus alba x Populus x berolinensis]
MEAIEELTQLSESMRQASALLADEDVDETTTSSSPSSSRRSSTFLNVVALGNVGAGKSAVLNSLIGHPVLPTGENGATRAPISIDLSRDSSVSSKSIILQIDSKNQQVSASALRHSLQERLSKVSSGRSRDEIYLKLRTSTDHLWHFPMIIQLRRWHGQCQINEVLVQIIHAKTPRQHSPTHALSLHQF